MPVDAGDTSVQVLTQTARTLPAAADVIRDIDEVTTGAKGRGQEPEAQAEAEAEANLTEPGATLALLGRARRSGR